MPRKVSFIQLQKDPQYFYACDQKTKYFMQWFGEELLNIKNIPEILEMKIEVDIGYEEVISSNFNNFSDIVIWHSRPLRRCVGYGKNPNGSIGDEGKRVFGRSIQHAYDRMIELKRKKYEGD